MPQGTVLEPILFSIYIDSLTSLVENGNVICYADDTVLLFRNSTWDLVVRNAEDALAKVKSWLDTNLLTMNVDKSHFMCFAMNKRNYPDIQNLRIHNYNCRNNRMCECRLNIKHKENIKYLGIYFDQHMKWDAHIEYITNKIRKLIYRFYLLRKILSVKMLKQVYMSLVESVLNYGISAWGAAVHKDCSPSSNNPKIYSKGDVVQK